MKNRYLSFSIFFLAAVFLSGCVKNKVISKAAISLSTNDIYYLFEKDCLTKELQLSPIYECKSGLDIRIWILPDSYLRGDLIHIYQHESQAHLQHIRFFYDCRKCVDPESNSMWELDLYDVIIDSIIFDSTIMKLDCIDEVIEAFKDNGISKIPLLSPILDKDYEIQPYINILIESITDSHYSFSRFSCPYENSKKYKVLMKVTKFLDILIDKGLIEPELVNSKY